MKLKKSFMLLVLVLGGLGMVGWMFGQDPKKQLHFVSVVSGVRIGNLTQLLKKRTRFVGIGLGVSCVLPVVARAGSPQNSFTLLVLFLKGGLDI